LRREPARRWLGEPAQVGLEHVDPEPPPRLEVPQRALQHRVLLLQRREREERVEEHADPVEPLADVELQAVAFDELQFALARPTASRLRRAISSIAGS
jgi:hypothetical protein